MFSWYEMRARGQDIGVSLRGPCAHGGGRIEEGNHLVACPPKRGRCLIVAFWLFEDHDDTSTHMTPLVLRLDACSLRVAASLQ
jgi:hypothetical protein